MRQGRAHAERRGSERGRRGEDGRWGRGSQPAAEQRKGGREGECERKRTDERIQFLKKS